MAEALAGSGNEPTPTLLKAYDQWGQGGWGALLTGSRPTVNTVVRF